MEGHVRKVGHMNISTTLDTYTPPTEKMAKKSIEIFEDIAAIPTK